MPTESKNIWRTVPKPASPPDRVVRYFVSTEQTRKKKANRPPQLSGTKFASQNPNDHGGRERARNPSAAEIEGFFASPAAEKSQSLVPHKISQPQRPRDTKLHNNTPPLNPYFLVCFVNERHQNVGLATKPCSKMWVSLKFVCVNSLLHNKVQSIDIKCAKCAAHKVA